MSVVKIDRFRCDRCKQVVDLEEGLVPDDWARFTLTFPVEAPIKVVRADVKRPDGYDLLLCETCVPLVLRAAQDSDVVLRDTTASVAFDIGDIAPEEIQDLVLATIERYRDQREFERAREDGAVVDADEGHTFRITHQVRGSSIVKGDAHHEDDDWFSESRTFEVRAWSLKEALYKAAELPFPVLMQMSEEPEDKPASPTEWLKDALRTLAENRGIPYGSALDSVSELMKRLRAEWEATFEVSELPAYLECAACQDYEEGITVKRVHDHYGAGDEEAYDKRDGYVATVHFGVGRADHLESACTVQVGTESLSTAPGKVTCRDCQDLISVPPRRGSNPFPFFAAPVVHLDGGMQGPLCDAGVGRVSRNSSEVTCDDCNKLTEIAIADSLEAVVASIPDEPPDEEEHEPPAPGTGPGGMSRWLFESVMDQEWYAPLAEFVGRDFLLIDQHQLEVRDREVVCASPATRMATKDRIDWKGPRTRKPKPEGYVTHLTWRGLSGGALATLCGVRAQDVDRAIGAGFSKHFELVDCQDCIKAATVSYGAVVQHKGYFVHRADWTNGEQRPVCGTYEYAGHEGPCRPLTEDEQAEFDAIREEDQ